MSTCMPATPMHNIVLRLMHNGFVCVTRTHLPFDHRSLRRSARLMHYRIIKCITRKRLNAQCSGSKSRLDSSQYLVPTPPTHTLCVRMHMHTQYTHTLSYITHLNVYIFISNVIFPSNFDKFDYIPHTYKTPLPNTLIYFVDQSKTCPAAFN